MTDKSLIATWLDLLESSREGEDVPIINALVLKEDNSLTIMALDLGPSDAWNAVLQEIGKFDTVELIFGIDRYSLPDQGVETASLVTVYHWRRDHDPSFWGYRFGVVPYDETGCRPAIWDHPYWTPLQQKEVTQLLDRSQERSKALLQKLGLPPELHLELIQELLNLPRPVTSELAHATVRRFLDERRGREEEESRA